MESFDYSQLEPPPEGPKPQAPSPYTTPMNSPSNPIRQPPTCQKLRLNELAKSLNDETSWKLFVRTLFTLFFQS